MVLPEQLYSQNQTFVTVAFKPQRSLSQYLNEIENPSSPLYRDFLGASEIGQLFGIGESSYSLFKTYFESFGLSVMPSSTLLSMTLTGSVQQLDEAFHTNIVEFSSSSSTYFVNTLPLSLPVQLSGLVTGVSGLDGAISPTNLLHYNVQLPDFSGASSNISINESTALYYLGGNYTWTDIGGVYGNYQFLWPSTLPAVTGAYNLWFGNSTIASEPDMGQGITIAVTEVGLISPSIISQFSEEVFHNPNQVPDRFTQIGVGIPNLTVGIQDANEWGWTGETALDIEYIAAMAPEAHIVLVGVPNDLLEGFDIGYQAIAQYLTSGGNCELNGTNVKIISGPSTGACDISITSNSHSFYAVETAFFASPFDVTVQEELVNILAIEGVTQFFASGDSGSNNGGSVLQTSRPVEAPGSVAVGGGQLTVASDGVEFPVTGVTTEISGIPMEVARANSIGSYTYWAFAGGGGGTYAASTTLQQPWWQNALDTYSTGTDIIPVVSNAAAFNMTLFLSGHWYEFYGGTSFATPITAGEWALIEEQALQAYGSSRFGSINALLFQAHNAYEAGIFQRDPFLPMMDIGVGWDWAPFNSYDWNFLNTSQEYPQDLNLPEWYPSIFNPAGSGWNFLQGLGLPIADVLDGLLIGAEPGLQHVLSNQPFEVLLNISGKLQPFESINGSTDYNFTILTSEGTVAHNVVVTAYSGGANNGTYGGGRTLTIPAPSGNFSYSPTYAPWPIPTNASEYGYFIVSSQGGGLYRLKSFQQFAVEQPPLSGNLSLSIETPYGYSGNSSVEVTMFEDFNVQDNYNFGTLGIVELNGEPLMNAIVRQTAISVYYQSVDPTVSPSQYAPGSLIGQWLTDGRGQFYMWNNPLVSANNGTVPTQVFMVQAFYQGKPSNSVIVYVEPQAGSFSPSVSLNMNGTALTGSVNFNDMKYLYFVNISIGDSPGQYTNISFPPNTTSDGSIPINFSPLPPAGTPVRLNMFAEGENTISLPFSFYVYSYGSQSTGNPIIWEYSITISNPGVSPSASLAIDPSGVVSGIVQINYSGSWKQAGARGILQLESIQGTSLLADAQQLNGTFAWNSTSFPDGFYSILYTVVTPTGLKSTSSITVYSDNMQLQLTERVNALEAEVSNLQNRLSVLQQELSNDSLSLSSLNARIDSLSANISRLTQELNSSEAQFATVQKLLSEAEIQLGNSSSPDSYLPLQITALKLQLQNEGSIITSLRSQISLLNGELSGLKAGLDGRESILSPWFWGTAAALEILFIGFLSGAITVCTIRVMGARRRKNRDCMKGDRKG